MIDAGADIIAGHHPHVIQDTEEYNGGLIAYSLGNFMFDQYFSKETLEGLMLFVTVSKDGIESHTKLKSTQDKTYAIIKVEPFQKTTENRIEDVEKVSCETPEITPVEDNLLFPIGRITKLGSYVPSNLVDIRESISTIGNKFICMTSIATEQLDALSVEIEKTGLKIIPVSGYRSKSYQKTLFEAWRKQFTITPPYFAVAEPEHSEHQLGTTVDLMSGTQELADFEKFGTSAEYVWMKEHAHEFGFVQSYTKGTEEITGYIEEAWHWRYVGTEIATDIKEQGITLTEYLQQN
jgi:D-alanyl-D-alanine carboxypeptidase